uniref:Inositol oxygenase n=1 Tax=Megaselia scalaris TaxID=36166 RepID=T1GY40_MEGSC
MLIYKKYVKIFICLLRASAPNTVTLKVSGTGIHLWITRAASGHNSQSKFTYIPPVGLIDPSELQRPEPKFADKEISMFRDYSIDDNDPIKERVRRTYRNMHLNQTVEFVRNRRDVWLKFNHFKATVREALEKLNDLIDESDPDTSLPNIIHAFQSAERARQEFPEHDWLHLTALIHDLGKVMAFYDEPQWAVVGDTFPVGCEWGQSIVYRQDSFEGNPDGENPLYNTKYGMYEPNCGVDNLLIRGATMNTCIKCLSITSLHCLKLP